MLVEEGSYFNEAMLKQKQAKTCNSNSCAIHLSEMALFKVLSTESGKQFQSAL